MHRYDKVDTEDIIERLQRLINLLKAQKEARENHEKNLSTPSPDGNCLDRKATPGSDRARDITR